ncbi:hypothetical protein [Mycolicibacterium sphagni]|uniref:hypothetical protein n=1 Tax=Mycolicibacterium sphagni TaxID=1786 RepID=UPI0021F2B1C0|nr:hypothetical protein [Mycolicibacterium sphagni]MCV7174795.1 hypothetical protein [Mycolicibacterium sphagni]
MTSTAVAIANPYWEAVRHHMEPHQPWQASGRVPRRPFPQKPGEKSYRTELVVEFAWTITDPVSVQFVVDHAGDLVVDPLAGTGYWGYLLGQHGVHVESSDIRPPSVGDDTHVWHPRSELWVPVAARDGVDSVLAWPAATLLLSWPPFDDPIGFKLVEAYRGDRIIFIGELGGNCGDALLHDVLTNDWALVARHTPVQWQGINDQISVFEREQVQPRRWWFGGGRGE